LIEISAVENDNNNNVQHLNHHQRI